MAKRSGEGGDGSIYYVCFLGCKEGKEEPGVEKSVG